MSHPQDVSPAEFAGLLSVLNHPEHQENISNRELTITRLEHPADHLARLTATVSGTDSLADWEVPNPTVRISIPEPPEEFAAFEGAPLTTSRVYTLAEVRSAERTVQIDLVRHAEPSPAMRWLSTLRPQDTVQIVGPRPHRIPGAGASRVLLADSSALPAATSILRWMPTSGQTLLIAAVPEDEFALTQQRLCADGSTLLLRRIEPSNGVPLAHAFRQLALPSDVSVWASGERDDVRQIRYRCKHELGLPPERTQVFGYWKRGVSNTRLDVARLRATQRLIAGGRDFFDLDDFELE